MAINEAAWEITEHQTNFARTFRREKLCSYWVEVGVEETPAIIWTIQSMEVIMSYI